MDPLGFFTDIWPTPSLLAQGFSIVLFSLGTSLFALAFGDRTGRVIGGATLISACSLWSIQLLTGPTRAHLLYALPDVAMLLVLLAVALRPRAPLWTLFVAAFYLLALLTTLISVADTGIGTLSYYIAENVWSAAARLAMVAGVWSTWRRRSAGAGRLVAPA